MPDVMCFGKWRKEGMECTYKAPPASIINKLKKRVQIYSLKEIEIAYLMCYAQVTAS